MSKDVLYLGDTGLREAASYLAGILSHFRIPFDYFSSYEPFDSGWLSRDYGAILLSDYPAENFTGNQLHALAAKVKNGLGLLMIGGWESFSGLGGGYTHTALKEVLPVVMQDGDDRVNSSSPCLIEKNTDHPILAGLPFAEEVTGVGGYNAFRAKEDSQTLLSLRPFQVRRTASQYHFSEKETAPLLVVGSYGRGRVAAFASDVAPHWVGGLVDWGQTRVKAQAKGSIEIEVGSHYARFFANLVQWVANSK